MRSIIALGMLPCFFVGLTTPAWSDTACGTDFLSLMATDVDDDKSQLRRKLMTCLAEEEAVFSVAQGQNAGDGDVVSYVISADGETFTVLREKSQSAESGPASVQTSLTGLASFVDNFLDEPRTECSCPCSGEGGGTLPLEAGTLGFDWASTNVSTVIADELLATGAQVNLYELGQELSSRISAANVLAPDTPLNQFRAVLGGESLAATMDVWRDDRIVARVGVDDFLNNQVGFAAYADVSGCCCDQSGGGRFPQYMIAGDYLHGGYIDLTHDHASATTQMIYTITEITPVGAQ